MESTTGLLSTCVGSFACPGIDTRVQGITVFSLIRQTLFVFTTLYEPVAFKGDLKCFQISQFLTYPVTIGYK
jgi:hypothetical protein